MRSKYLNVVWFVLLSAFYANTASASLIVGENYLDGDGVRWEYVGEFDLVAGAAHWSVATPVNGLQAAALLFPSLTGNIALAAFSLQFDVSAINIGDNIVNHLAWYDGSGAAVARFAENRVADVNTDGNYDRGVDVSAWIDDRAFEGDYTSYVFKMADDIPEPSTLALFALALCGLVARRSKT